MGIAGIPSLLAGEPRPPDDSRYISNPFLAAIRHDNTRRMLYVIEVAIKDLGLGFPISDRNSIPVFQLHEAMIAGNQDHISCADQSLHLGEDVSLDFVPDFVIDLAQIASFTMQVVIADVEHQTVELASFQLSQLLPTGIGVCVVDKRYPLCHFAFGGQAKIARGEDLFVRGEPSAEPLPGSVRIASS